MCRCSASSPRRRSSARSCRDAIAALLAELDHPEGVLGQAARAMVR
jgi:hypothetical protein